MSYAIHKTVRTAQTIKQRPQQKNLIYYEWSENVLQIITSGRKLNDREFVVIMSEKFGPFSNFES